MMIDGNEIAFKHIKEIQGDFFLSIMESENITWSQNIFQIHSNPNKSQLYVDKNENE